MSNDPKRTSARRSVLDAKSGHWEKRDTAVKTSVSERTSDKSSSFSHNRTQPRTGRSAARSEPKPKADLPDPLSPEEDAAITAAAESDPDALPLTDEQLARMRPATDVLPQLVRHRGPQKAIELQRQQATIRP